MINFKLSDGNAVEIDRAQLEEKILEGIISKLDEAREHHQGFYNVLKAAVNMVVSMGGLDIKAPKGVNTLDYLIATYVSVGLETLEQKPLPVEGRVLLEKVKEALEDDQTS